MHSSTEKRFTCLQAGFQYVYQPQQVFSTSRRIGPSIATRSQHAQLVRERPVHSGYYSEKDELPVSHNLTYGYYLNVHARGSTARRQTVAG